MWDNFDRAMNAEIGTAQYTASWNGFNGYKKHLIEHMDTQAFSDASEYIKSIVNRLKIIDESNAMVGLEKVMFYQLISKEWKKLNKDN